MKNFLFLFLFLGLSVQLSAVAAVVDPVSDETTAFASLILSPSFDQPSVTAELSTREEKLLHCFIINTCGTDAQWCNEGLHPPLGDYIRALRRRFCDVPQA
jgi:hypothetical protein